MEQLLVKTFDVSKYFDKSHHFDEKMIGVEFERACFPIVRDILKNYEDFENIEEGPSLRGRSFDFFGYKQGLPYIIEVKGSLKRFQSVGELQRQRLQTLLPKLPTLHIALLQIKVRTGEYRILCDEEFTLLFHTQYVSLDPVVDWLIKRLPDSNR